jgi:hypothetical protein
MKFVVGAILLVGFLTACDDPDERYDAGYGDGYAVGFNTACEIRATLIGGDFGNEDYALGYADGVTEGIIDCNQTRD